MAARRRGRKFWQRLLAEVECEGSVVEVARRHKVNERTLHWWCWKLRTERRDPSEMLETARLLPVVLRAPELPAEPPTPQLVVEWDDVRVRVPSGTDARYVAALVGALRGC